MSYKMTYRDVHRWVAKHYGKADKCEFDETHEASMYHWSNKSGEYKLKRSDWQQLCPTCHRYYDQQFRDIKTHCKNGHELAGTNIRLRKGCNGIWRVCKLCAYDYQVNWRLKRKLNAI